jgi:hypothetical protein
MNGPGRVAVSVSDMARMVGLSRSRFHQLLKEGFFPAPERDTETGRPFFGQAGQACCLEVRRTSLGINGKAVMFYARRFGVLEDRRPRPGPNNLDVQTSSRKKKTPPATTPSRPKHAALIESLKQLGLSDLTEETVAKAVAVCFPGGLEGQPHETGLLAVFRHLVRPNSGGNVGR